MSLADQIYSRNTHMSPPPPEENHSIVGALIREGLAKGIFPQPNADLVYSHGCFFAIPDDNAIKKSMVDGTYEVFELKILKNVLAPGCNALDIGACIGLYTCVMAKLVGSEGTVAAFEPGPSNAELLKTNVYINQIKNVHFSPVALHDENKDGILYLSKDNAGDNCLYPTNGKPIEVALRKLDSMISKDTFIQFIKIDTQGHEIQVLRGAMETIKRQPSLVMLVEYCPCVLREAGNNPMDLIDLLNELGFEIYGMALEMFDGCFDTVRSHYRIITLSRENIVNMLPEVPETMTNLWCMKGDFQKIEDGTLLD